METALEEIFKIRGEIVSRCSYYEQRMDLFIAKYYKGDDFDPFKEEVLEQPYFNFELKKRIFFTLLGKYHPEYFKTFPKGGLTRLQEIRNMVAHGAVVADPKDPEAKMACLRHGAKNTSIRGLVTEFDAVRASVKVAFESLPLTSAKEVDIELSGIG